MHTETFHLLGQDTSSPPSQFIFPSGLINRGSLMHQASSLLFFPQVPVGFLISPPMVANEVASDDPSTSSWVLDMKFCPFILSSQHDLVLTPFFDTCQDGHCRRGRLPIWRVPVRAVWMLANNTTTDRLEKILDLILRARLGFGCLFCLGNLFLFLPRYVSVVMG
jgi:hypothetical protein